MSQNSIHICGNPWGIGVYSYVEEDGTEGQGYGFYRPENPHHFFPDVESCTPEEIAAHKVACAEWDKTRGTEAK